MDIHRTKWRKNIADNFNRLSRVHERYRRQTDRQTDGRTTTYSEREREFTFAKNSVKTVKDLRRQHADGFRKPRTKIQVFAMLLCYGSCLTNRSDRHKNLLLTANLNSLTQNGKTKLGLTILPARQHLRLSTLILYTASESQKRQEWNSLGLLSKW